MKSNAITPALKSWPRLVAEEDQANPKNETGFLQLTNTDKKIKIGDTLSREFRLLQCLFSAQNFISAKYAPVTQTYERLYLAIQMSGDTLNKKLTNVKSADGEMTHIVQTALRTLERGAAGKHLVFINVGSMLRMDIPGAVSI